MRPMIFASALVTAVLASAPAAQEPAMESAADEQTLKALTIGTDGPALIEFFRERLRTEADRNHIHRLIAELGDDDFATREAARGAILRIGPKLLDPLELARIPRNVEAAGRISECIRVLGNDPRDRQSASSTAVVMAAARLLAARKPAGAAEVLLDFLVIADQEVADEILRVLPALATTKGKTDPALAKALTAREPVRRASAGVVLARADVADQRDAVRKLLLDPDVDVRLRVGLALANAKNWEAISPLIALLGKLPPQEAWQITDLLERLAGEKAPQAPPGTDDAGRAACRDAWAAWWREHGAAVNMAAVDDPRPQLGYTLFVLPDQGRIREVDRAHKLRWEIRLLRSPRSVQLLPRDRVLIAEGGGEITERNLKGDIQWRREVIDAAYCQRLPNGNTFVVTNARIFEFDGAGRQQSLYTANGGTLITARKLPSGHIIAIDSNIGYLKFDAAGREISRFPVGRVSNNCLDVLPNGNIVVPNFSDGKIKEYNPRGTVVWQIDFPSPFSAQRLPNGNTLVACHEPARVVEVNRAGKVVWEHKLESPNHRPWFASRR